MIHAVYLVCMCLIQNVMFLLHLYPRFSAVSSPTLRQIYDWFTFGCYLCTCHLTVNKSAVIQLFFWAFHLFSYKNCLWSDNRPAWARTALSMPASYSWWFYWAVPLFMAFYRNQRNGWPLKVIRIQYHGFERDARSIY